jgi:leader peptidase (prepilin peptidase)/N-methyltransferase
MALTIVICILFGLIIGDILFFSIHNLSVIFTEAESETKTAKNNGIIKEYINFILTQLKENRRRFLSYYLSVDALTITLTITIVIMFGVTLKAAAALLFCYALIVLTYVDAKTQYLPDIITKPLIVAGVIQSYFNLFTDLRGSIMGAFIGYFSLWAINTAFRMIRNKDGMGYGDFKLLAAIGAWTGFMQLPFVILSSSIIGIFVALGLAKFAKNDISAPSPFGPSLAISGVISLLWGREILGWYLGLYSY